MKNPVLATLIVVLSVAVYGEDTRVLLPIFLDETAGANGSVFVTDLTVRNGGSDGVVLRGLWNPCQIVCGSLGPPIQLGPGAITRDIEFDSSPNPGRVVFLPKSNRVEFGLRVWDRSRYSQTIGTEIPAVREEQFFSSPFSLIGLPNARDHRALMRLYAFEDAVVKVRLFRPWTDGLPDQLVEEREVALTGAGPLGYDGAGDTHYRPAYAQLSDFVLGVEASALRVEIVPLGKPVWAFISVTNNYTQQITTITPSLRE